MDFHCISKWRQVNFAPVADSWAENNQGRVLSMEDFGSQMCLLCS